MNGYLSLLMALAWPLVTLAIALIFRQDVTQALRRVGRLKYRDLEVTFQENLRQAEDLARKLPPSVPSSDSIILEIDPGKSQPFVRQRSTLDHRAAERQNLLSLADRSPEKAIETTWNLVARTLPQGDRGHLPETEARIAEILQSLRNRVTQREGQPPTIDEARRFVQLACPLVSRIEGRT